MARTHIDRRTLTFTHLADAVDEGRRLLDHGYTAGGRWSLGQMFRHLRVVQDPSIDGYPGWMAIGLPVRPIMRRLLLPKLLRFESPQGLRTFKVFVPPASLDDETEWQAFTNSVSRFVQHTGAFHPHPSFGRLDRQTLERLHAAHAAHHLGFLEPGSSR